MEDKHLKLKEIELADFKDRNIQADYYDGDIAIIDNISDLTNVAPFYAKMNFIILCSKGRIQFDINNTPLILKEQQILLSSPYVILDNYLFSPDFECKIVCMSDDIIHAMLSEQVNIWNLHVHNQRTTIMQLPEEDQEQFIYYYELIKFKMRHQERHNSTIAMQSIIQAMLVDILGLLKGYKKETAEETSTHSKILFNSFLQLLASKDIKRQPVDSYAKELNITPKYLTMLCTKHSGRHASDWIVQYVKEDIRYCLLYTDLSIKEISSKLGFPNTSFFGSYVRKQFGMSPTQVRRHANGK